MPMTLVVNLSDVNLSNVDLVGGKNASTGEMIQRLAQNGINVPGGFATTSEAYERFLGQNRLDKQIFSLLNRLKTSNVNALHQASEKIRRSIMATPLFPELKNDIAAAYASLKHTSVAVRSSATAEDLPLFSFAGQQDTFLNVKGLDNIYRAIKMVYASLYTSRAISYRHHQQFSHEDIALSVGVQPMIRSDQSVSGVIFTVDPESGFDKVMMITASYGLGETIVQGKVNPDEFFIFKPHVDTNQCSILSRHLGEKNIKMIYAKNKHPNHCIKTVSVPQKARDRYCINDHDLEILARYALLIEKHYQTPMDIEWAKDGPAGKLYIVQARPVTVKQNKQNEREIERYTLSKKSKVLIEGQSIGQYIGSGTAKVILHPSNMNDIRVGDVLVTDMTDPDWEPIMKRASAIVTNRGGRTCHAAIIARELGIPAVVGCGKATSIIKKNTPVTVSCAEGQVGYVYVGKLPYTIKKIAIDHMPSLPVDICLNLGNPERAFSTQFIPNEGVGLARLEFIISNIGIHPNAALNPKQLPIKIQKQIKQKTAAYKNPVEYYVEKLREGIATIAAAFYPKQVIFRFSDFKSNEYANLLGGYLYEPQEENPMLGFRGASRYNDERFKCCFELECKAFKRVRDDMGLVNAQLMVPFVRTVSELKHVIALIEHFGLKRGNNQLKIYMMCEIPSNVVLATDFLPHVDGFSIGSNDLTQLVLGLDRDSSVIAHLFDERNEAVKRLLHNVIKECNKQNKYIGICGQAPSDYPDFAEWLMHEGIQSMSLNPDTVIETWLSLAKEKAIP